MTFGELILAIRTEKGISQKDMANSMEMSVSSLSRYENRKRKPPKDKNTLAKFAKALEVSFETLENRAYIENGEIPPAYFNKVSADDYDILLAYIVQLSERSNK